MEKCRIIIGVDFDNTIVDYDELMYQLANVKGWIPQDLPAEKQKIRDCIRLLDDGEVKWQQLQAEVYGPYIGQAKLIEGVQEFFAACHAQQIPLFIVSHKTQYAAQDTQQVDLHKAALQWMRQNGLQEKVFFEPTRLKKIERIKSLGCTYFIDDLVETFMEEAFPVQVRKILYAPKSDGQQCSSIMIMNSWEKINDSFFANLRK